MAEHYTKNTVSVSKFCKQCNRATTHSVSGGRLGHCLEHSPKPREEKKTLERTLTENLFK